MTEHLIAGFGQPGTFPSKESLEDTVPPKQLLPDSDGEDISVYRPHRLRSDGQAASGGSTRLMLAFSSSSPNRSRQR